MSRLKNKVAVVTGGTSGIGLGTVKRLVAEGAVAYVFARRKEELEKMAASLGPNVATVSGDVRNLDDLDRLYATIVADGKKLDIRRAECRRRRQCEAQRRSDRQLLSYHHQ